MPIVILSERQAKRNRPSRKKSSPMKSKGGQMSRGRNMARKTGKTAGKKAGMMAKKKKKY